VDPMSQGLVFNHFAAWGDLWPDCEEMARAHWYEVRRNGETFPYEVSVSAWENIFKAGLMQINTARSEGQLVGYLIWFVTENLESAGQKVATMGPFYVRPEWAGAGKRLWMGSLDRLRVLGCKAARPHRSFHGERRLRADKFFRAMGAEPYEMVY